MLRIHTLPPAVPPTTTLRLTGGNKTASSTVGRLELYRNGLWGTVSLSQSPNQAESDAAAALASVACRQLGYDSAAFQAWSTFGDPSVSAQWNMISCDGSEANVAACGGYSNEAWDYRNSEMNLACYNASSVGEPGCLADMCGMVLR